MKRVYQVSKGLAKNEETKALKELKLGYLNLSDGMFSQAKINFLLVLQYDSKCADAYWGLMLQKFQLKNEDDLYSNPVQYKSAITLPECESALNFADETQKAVYQNLLEEIYKVNEGDKY
jgi:hypothetical protein